MTIGEIILRLLVGGSACVDYSFFGQQQAGAGPTAIFLLIFLRMAAEYKPDLILHENVLGFPLAMIIEVLDELFEFEEGVLQPDIAGWAIERKRKYMIGRFRMKFKTLGNS